MSGDKERKDRVEAEVLKTLQSLDNLEPVEAEPYFMTRLEARIDQPESAGLRLGLRLAPVFLALAMIINVATAWKVLSASDSRESIVREQNLKALAGEYLYAPTDLLSGLNNK